MQQYIATAALIEAVGVSAYDGAINTLLYVFYSFFFCLLRAFLTFLLLVIPLLFNSWPPLQPLRHVMLGIIIIIAFIDFIIV